MADFNSSLPVRTQNPGDVASILVDATTHTQGAAVDASGNQQVLVNNPTGAPVNSQDAADGPVTPGTAATKAMLIAAQYNSTLPTLSTGQQAAVQVDASGRLIIAQATAAALNATVAQGAPNTIANAWPIKITDGTNTASLTGAGELKVDVTQPLPAGTNLIGSVKSQTEDGSGTAITSTLVNSKQRLDVDLSSEGATGAAVPVTSVQVAGSDGTDLRTLATDTSGQLKVDIFSSTGTAFTSLNPLPVSIANSTPGNHINDFKDASSIAAGSSDAHQYTVSAGKTLTLNSVIGAGSGKAKMVVAVETGVATGIFTTFYVQFNSTAEPNMQLIFTDPIAVATGVRVQVTMTNDDIAAQDLYSTICGTEN